MNYTIIKTAKRIIKGQKVLVETLLFTSNRQDVRYRINEGEILTSEQFWSL